MPTITQTVEKPISREQALEIAERCAELLKREFGATRVIVFGSARGDMPWHEGSDLDLAVEGVKPQEFMRAWSAVNELAHDGLYVDLVDLTSATPRFRTRILGEVEMPTDPILALRSMVDDQLAALEIIAKENDELFESLPGTPTRAEIRAVASILNDLYSGVEGIFERIAVQIDGNLPRGEQWHSELLRQMSQPQRGVRSAVIDESLRRRLHDYLGFRHVFVHSFGYMLKWERMKDKSQEMTQTLERLHSQLDQFFTALGSQEKE